MTPTILAGTANGPLANAIAFRLGTRPMARLLERFPDGEFRVVLREPVRGRDVYIVQPTCPPVDEHVMELLFLADAARRAGAERITAVVPYFGYARQDRRCEGDVAIGARVVADLIEAAGISRLITMDLHTPEVEGFFRIPVEHMSAARALADAVRPAVERDSVLVAPDIGAAKIAEAYQRLLGLPMVVLRKARLDPQHLSMRGIVGEDVTGKAPIVVDDMISTGATIEAAVEALRAAGCRDSVAVVATHGLFVQNAVERLQSLGIRQLVVANTVERTWPILFPVRTVDISSHVADAISRLHYGMVAEQTALRA